MLGRRSRPTDSTLILVANSSYWVQSCDFKMRSLFIVCQVRAPREFSKCNRVVDLFGEFVPEFGANFVIALAVVTIHRSEAYEVGHRFNVSYEARVACRALRYRGSI